MKRVLALVSVLFTLLFALPGWADDAPAAAAAVTQAVAPVAAAVADAAAAPAAALQSQLIHLILLINFLSLYGHIRLVGNIHIVLLVLKLTVFSLCKPVFNLC